MEMLLMGICLSMFALAITCLAFGAATHTEQPSSTAQPMPEAAKAAAAPARFFVDQPIIPAAPHASVPMEALLAQIENHVRLEQAAAESFLESPTPALLHSRTISPLVN